MNSLAACRCKFAAGSQEPRPWHPLLVDGIAEGSVAINAGMAHNPHRGKSGLKILAGVECTQQRTRGLADAGHVSQDGA